MYRCGNIVDRCSVTAQEFTWRDAGVAALTGGLSSISFGWLVVASIFNGAYSAYTAYEDGANTVGILGSGITSALLNMVSFGDLAQAGNDLVGIAISGFTDLVFGAGFSSIDAAVSKTFTASNSGNIPSKKKTSTLEVIRRKRQVSTTRIYNGQSIIVGTKNCSYYGNLCGNPNRVYCYVQF